VGLSVLALDLERTLITEAMTANPRPGLFDFLTFCHERFGRVVIFTTVEEEDAREVLEGLDREGLIPFGLLPRLEYVNWTGEFKDLCFVADAEPNEVVLVDDDPGWVKPDQRDRWVPIVPWDGGPDKELARVRGVLERLLAHVWGAGTCGGGVRARNCLVFKDLRVGPPAVDSKSVVTILV
jgi:hypothetical protein